MTEPLISLKAAQELMLKRAKIYRSVPTSVNPYAVIRAEECEDAAGALATLAQAEPDGGKGDTREQCVMTLNAVLDEIDTLAGWKPEPTLAYRDVVNEKLRRARKILKDALAQRGQSHSEEGG